MITNTLKQIEEQGNGFTVIIPSDSIKDNFAKEKHYSSIHAMCADLMHSDFVNWYAFEIKGVGIEVKVFDNGMYSEVTNIN